MPRPSPVRPIRLSALPGPALVVLALAVRLSLFMSDRSFWGDEAYIALNLRSRGLRELFSKLDFEQTMPVPLLLASRISGALLGHGELAYRLPMLLAGCILPILLWRVYPRLVGRIEAWLMLAFAAVWLPLVYYSSELKQYGVDATVTVVTLAAALQLHREPDRPAGWRWLAAWGVAALLLSQPSVFVLAGAGLSLVLSRRFVVSREWRKRCVLMAVAWGLTFGALYIAFYHAADTPYMRRSWASAFLTPGAGWAGRTSAAIWTLSGTSELPGTRVLVLLPVFLAGAWFIRRRMGLAALILAVAPVTLLGAAAATGHYPIAPRLVLFHAPLLFWVLASAIAGIAASVPKPLGPMIGATVFGLLWVPAAGKAIITAARPPVREGTRQMAALVRSGDPTTPVFLIFGEYQSWAYYTEDWSDPDRVVRQVRSAFACVSVVLPPPSCEALAFPGSASVHPVEVGSPPPTEPGDSASRIWARRQVRRLTARKERRVWVFYPLYGDRFAQRGLAPIFEQALAAAGARREEAIRVGQSVLYRVALP
ncbi:MAG TPA: glycosyltransferase family 39 protein [Gemmatimonadales bacterium]